MKTFKIAGLTDAAEALLQRLREVEVGAGSSWRMTIIMAAVVGFAPSMLSPLITFAVTARTLDATRIFTALSFLVLLTEPLSQLFQYVPPLLAAFACLARIQVFLEKECRVDFREDAGTIQPSKELETDSTEKNDTIIRITKGDFGWEDKKPILSNIALDIPARSLTIVIGPTACGKSTLLKVLLGETPLHSGRVLMGSATRGIGFCDQTPFLTNASVRDNIIGYTPFDQARYDEVLEATMLLPDIATFPQGDLTKVGSGGVTLSGGQKQRVSMARALYSNSSLFLFDDTLSGLDADTEEQVFRRVFSADGIIRRRNATAVLCTHSVRHLPSADHVIALSQDGLISEQGTFEDLDALGGYVHSLKVKAVNKSDDSLTLDSSDSTPEDDDIEKSTGSKARKPPAAMWTAADERSRQTGDITHFTDTVAGVATLRAFDWTQKSLDFNLELLDSSQRPAYLLAMVQHCLSFILSSVVTVLATLVVVLATQVKAITGPGLTGASMVTLMSLGNYVSQLILMYTLLEISLGAVSRLKSFRDTVLPESTPEEDAVLPSLWPWRGEVDIQDVSASYSDPGQPTESGNSDLDSSDLVLKNINMSILPGEKIAICGRSGSGKSSLLLLLLRLFDPLPGSADGITIDGIPLRRVDRSSLRQRVIAVPQDSVFFPDGHSFKTNLDPSNLSTESDCKEVLGAVGLWQVVEDNGGLDASLSTNMLSHGQRQLFGLARAMLRQRLRSTAARSQTLDSNDYPDGLFEKGGDVGGLLLLDEVGSSVDKDTERTMQALISQEFAGYTTIMISHRLDAVMDFDRVLVMDRGQIVESGRPRELVQQESSMFKNLWAISGGRS
ncbi:hypothetical protein TrVGV298_010806 [Trichoderma virens]|nr:hypothetical protein TrVGV298_010806 [Trichoderma virens]